MDDHQFGVGNWVIDTKRKQSAEIVGMLEPGKDNVSQTVYILDDGDSNLYIQSEYNIIAYDKYYEFN